MADVIDLRRARRLRQHERQEQREQWIPLPEELVSVVQFGVDHPDAVGPRFWAAIEAAVAEQVFDEVPSSASELSLELDADQLEVRARWRDEALAR
jgi:hypothetical protein